MVLTAVSVGLARELERDFAGVSVAVVPNGVDLDRFHRAADDVRTVLRAELGTGRDDVVILFVGGDWAHKGLEVAIEAVALAKASGVDRLRLFVVGVGDERRYESLARSAGVADSVLFFGPRSDAERFYKAADIFVLPTHYEALPLVVLEALAAEVPIVAPPVNGVVDLFSDRQPGILVERTSASVAEALTALAQDAELRSQMGRVGRAIASRMTWERSAEGTLELFEAILDDKRRGVGGQNELVGSSL